MQVDLLQPNGTMTAQGGNGNAAFVQLAGTSSVQLTNVYPAASIPLHSSSGNVANAAATSTLAAIAAKTTYISGFEVTGGGATAGALVLVTVSGLVGGPATYTVAVATGATVGNAPLVVAFNPPLPASALNTAIVVSVPALGVGSTNSSVVAHGFQA